MSAQPQGLNVPSIIVTGAVGVILVMTVIEGVRAYYYHTLGLETERKDEVNPQLDLPRNLYNSQMASLKIRSNVKLGDAMQQVADNAGKLPESLKKPTGPKKVDGKPTSPSDGATPKDSSGAIKDRATGSSPADETAPGGGSSDKAAASQPAATTRPAKTTTP